MFLFFFHQKNLFFDLKCSPISLQLNPENQFKIRAVYDEIPYFFDYKMYFSFQNNPKDLDPSCKMDLDLWDCLGRVKLVL